MAIFIPDASVTIPWCARDEASPWTDALLNRLRSGDQALVPPLWVYEITNTVLHLKQRMTSGRFPSKWMLKASSVFLIAY